MTAVDRDLLRTRLAEERRLFEATHPKSAELAQQAKQNLLTGVPMAWMTRWPGSFPRLLGLEAEGARVIDVDGIEYVDFALGDTGAMTGHALPFVTEAVRRAGAGAASPPCCPPRTPSGWRGELERRFGLPLWQFALTATDANRFVLRIARYRHRPSEDPGLRLVLSRHRRRDAGHHGPRRRDRAAALQHRGPGASRASPPRWCEFNDLPALEAALAPGDVACVLAEPALTNIGIVLPDPGYHDALREHHPRDRHPARHRRDPHHLRRPGRGHRGVGPAARHAHHRQAHRRRHPDGGVRPERGIWGSARGVLLQRGRGRERHRRHPGRQRPRRWRPCEPTLGNALRDEDFADRHPAGGALDGRRGRGDRRAAASPGRCSASAAAASTGSATRRATAPRPRPPSTPDLEAWFHLYMLNQGCC